MSHKHAAHASGCKFIVLALVAVLTLVCGCSTADSPVAGPRPQNWARPVAASLGLPNLHRVNSSLYRSAQPAKEGFVFLDTQTSLASPDRPIKTVVSLRAFQDDAPIVTPPSPLRLEEIRFETWHPENKDVVNPIGNE